MSEQTPPELIRIARTLKERSFPKIFAVELCADCNLACSMCHHPGMQRPKGKLPMPLWRKCADEIAATAPHTDVWFSFCGEPLLDPERLFEMLEYGASVGLLSQNLNTNGVLLSAAVADRVLRAPLKSVVIGLDGFSAATYEAIRVGAKRDEVYANVAYLLEARQARELQEPSASMPEVMVQFIEMPENRHELEEFSAHWSARGGTLKVRNMLSWGGQLETPLSVPNESRIPCPWALNMMHLFWDGRVPRCPGDTEGAEGAGNAWDASLAELWGGLGDYRRSHLEHRFDDLPARCHECKDWMVGASRKIRRVAGPAGAPLLDVMVEG